MASDNTQGQSQAIPHFGLYGESTVEDPAFIHLENIESRSSANGWRIKPHRHGRMFQILVIYSGSLEVQLDDQMHKRDTQCAVVIPSGIVHGFRFSPGTQGVVLTFAEPLLVGDGFQSAHAYFDLLFTQPRIIPFDQPSSLINDLKAFIYQIEQELTRADTGRALMSGWLAQAVLMTLRRQYDRVAHGGPQQGAQRREILAYRELVEIHFKEHWTLEQYASALGMSTDRLNRLCKLELDQTGKAVVQDRLLLEAKRRLIYTRSSQDEIAYGLGFKDTAYFSRFFKRHTGKTPGAFRDENNIDTQTEMAE